MTNVLVTGGSGYLGGSLLASWAGANITGYDKLYALVRSDSRAAAVKSLYDAEPVTCILEEDNIRHLAVDNDITVVFYLIDAYRAERPVSFIKALGEVKKATGREVHFVYTTGTKQFSEHAGAPTDKPLLDTDPNLYDIQRGQKAPVEEMKVVCYSHQLRRIDAGEKFDVRMYLFSPCIVYGKGLGFGNLISIQTVDVVTAAKGAGRVYRIGPEGQTWPVCHISDNTSLYIALARAILDGSNPDHGKLGYYLASSGSASWDDIYAAVAKAMAKRGVIDDDTVAPVTEEALRKISDALNVEPASAVSKIDVYSRAWEKAGLEPAISTK
ncbi:nad dependent epimerase dehydratase family protein [Colletotrichum asianum]|uniref:Nad dependent epimerase dehydratase family protein n=1 Tax=Colletotrichum asianum TaxID=702518 RepID=A0A8H3W3D6_9PEZI|nr:nad dependent epimerase dehydratase family protein [Colletotrichum asianum]